MTPARARGLLLACMMLLGACGTAGVGGPPAAPAARVPSGDWTQFGDNAQRTGVGPADTGISARNLSSLRVRTVHLGGTVDSSALELHAVDVGGRRHDLVIVTTTYGRTVALDAGTGARLWEFTPGDVPAVRRSPPR